ncbi:DUF1871 family protein [Bacillus sp. B190/17]|uniref:DUF1871 family protein n=1 Tax=Bacillus lumedeiriae TaxID=3058829 RepID=A0ABW8IAK8_9BACI
MNKDVQTNIKLSHILRDWDPFAAGGDFYDTETADTIQAVYQYDDQNELAQKIQEIYEFSFEQKLPLASCLEVAERLLQVKNEASCQL